jgi:hypothetical protein
VEAALRIRSDGEGTEVSVTLPESSPAMLVPADAVPAFA